MLAFTRAAGARSMSRRAAAMARPARLAAISSVPRVFTTPVYRNPHFEHAFSTKEDRENWKDVTHAKDTLDGVELSQGVEAELNKQACVEMEGSQSYLAASIFFRRHNFDGIADYMQQESQSEREHMMLIVDYINKRNSHAEVPKAKKHSSEWRTPIDVFEELYALEVDVFRKISALMDLAQETKDHATYSFLSGLLEKQVDEVAEMDGWLAKVRAYGKLPGLLYHLDKEMRKASKA